MLRDGTCVTLIKRCVTLKLISQKAICQKRGALYTTIATPVKPLPHLYRKLTVKTLDKEPKQLVH